jgi:hypothetical protein
MGKENEKSNSDSPELTLFEDFEQNDDTEKASEKKQIIEPLKEIQDDSIDPARENIADLIEEPSGAGADSPSGKSEEIEEIDPIEAEVEISADAVEAQVDDEPVQFDSPDDTYGENSDSAAESPDDFGGKNLEIPVEEIGDDGPSNDGEIAKIENHRDKNEETAASDGKNEKYVMGLDDDDIDNDAPNKQILPPAESKKKSATEKSESKRHKEDSQENKTLQHKAKNRKTEKAPIRRGSFPKVIGLALLAAVITVVVIYMNPSLLGLKKASTNAPPEAIKTTEPVQPTQKQVYVPEPPSEDEVYASRLEDADRLRDELLKKKDEIYNLKATLQNGIAELEDQTVQEVRKAGITTFAQALKNKCIELNLRTIQRRQNYIRELEKPAYWTRRGSEELLYLKRKAQIDLQVKEIAAGIDLDKHMRHISAAIQKFQPSAEKLAIEPQSADLPPLETIWSQIINHLDKNGQSHSKSSDKEIVEEICSGYFNRIAKLTSISKQAAKCLSKMNGSELFLNGVTEISPAEAKHLFQWPGNWICLNGVKELAPAVAEHLFKWKGTWISLNGLTEFPPGLAKYLMKWNGKQLELMGLKYDSENADKKALKYLALWETTGGKLYVTDDVRKVMQRVMM